MKYLKKLPAFLLLIGYHGLRIATSPRGVYNYKFTSETHTVLSTTGKIWRRPEFGRASLAVSRTRRPRASTGKLKQTPALR